MNTGKRVLKKSLLLGFLWPILVFGLTARFENNPLHLIAPFTLVPSIVTCLLIDHCSWANVYLIIPTFIIYLLPYFWYLKEKQEKKSLYWASSSYSFICAFLGALAIVGKHV